ncbi:MAG: hypothetical protein V3W18_07230 [candidate division Zixibacteria bacterium]
MSSSVPKKQPSTVDNYPIRIIAVRWFFIAAEMGLATYFAFLFTMFNLGFIFLIYGFISAFVLLPLIRCVRCYYYGKRCNFGWGKLVAFLFPKADDGTFSSRYGYSFIFWPLRIIPIGVGFIQIIDGFMSGFGFVPQGLLGIYFIVIFLHRKFYRKAACSRCRQRSECPVYDSSIMRGTAGNPPTVG